MSNERHPDAVEFIVIDRATCYTVTSANMQVEEESVLLIGRLSRITLYAEGEYVVEFGPGDTIYNPDDLAFVQKAADAAGIELADQGLGEFGVPSKD